ncbi:MAG: hypothetical protein LBN39_10065, partial [Planctomycetaceae bacterium]|nr:hypothetical protein [Planctomycetaceae bacterium]
ENQGKRDLRLTLPEGVAAADVRSVQQNGKRISWRYQRNPQGGGTVIVPLPEKKRFVAVSIEYSYRDAPLKQQRLSLREPTADVPVLTKQRTVWFPSDYEAGLRFHPVQSPHTNSKGLWASLLFEPLFTDAWKQILYGKQHTKEETAAAAFLNYVEKRMQNSAGKGQGKSLPLVSPPPLTWAALFTGEKELLETLNEQLPERKKVAEVKILIAPQALAMLGISPAAAVPINEKKRSAELLERSGITVLAAPAVRSNRRECTFYITSKIQTAEKRNSESRWISAAEWNRTAAAPLPWTLPPEMLPTAASMYGWKCFDVPQDAENPLYLFDRQTFASYHYLAFLLAVILTSRRPFSRPLLLVLSIVILGVTARFTTPSYAGIPYGAFLGTVISLGFALIRPLNSSVPLRRISADSPTHFGTVGSDSTSDGKKEKVLPLFLFCLCLISFPAHSFAQETTPKSAEGNGSLEPYRVFFPIDSDRKIVGNTVWLPTEFLQLLSRNVRRVEQNMPNGWNIEQAEYQGALIRRPQTQLLELSDDFKAVYDIQLTAGSMTLVLPPLPVRQDLVLWDTRPVPAVKRTAKDGTYNALLIPLENETAGKHVLSVPLSPKQELLNESCRITFDIPKVPNAVLRLKTPQDAQPVRVANALGAVFPNSLEEPVFAAQIGPSEKLAFSWNSESAADNSSVIEADQYFRLSARLTQVEMRAVFQLHLDSGKVKQLLIQTDPRWHRSGQFYCDDVPIDSVETQLNSDGDSKSIAGEGTGQSETTRIVFQNPVSGTITVEAGFVLHDFNGIGTIRLPQFNVLNAKINRSMLAVFADPVLQIEETGGREQGTANNKSAADFDPLPAEQVSPLTFYAEYDLLKTDSSRVLSIQAKKTIPILTQRQSVTFDNGSTAVECRGSFQVTGDVFQQRFTAPSALEIESVEVQNADGSQTEIRFRKLPPLPSSSPPPVYNIFFRKPVTGTYSITVRGHFPVSAKKQSVPLIAFQNAEYKDAVLTLSRMPSVIVVLTGENGSYPLSVSEENRLNVSPGTLSSPLSFQLFPNRPAIQGEQITMLRRTGAQEIVFDAAWDISGGELNTVPFLWDDRCTVTSIEPPMPYRVQQQNGHSVLVLMPPVPLSGQQHLRLKAAFNSTDLSLSIPRITLQTENENVLQTDTGIRRYLVLPRYAGEMPIPWNYTALDNVDDETRKYLKDITETQETDSLFLRALTADYSATVQREKTRSVVNLYDITFFVQRDGTVYGTASIHLKNRGQDTFTLYLPDGYELVHLFGSGSVSMGNKLSANHWKFEAGNSEEPQFLRIVFRTSASKTAAASVKFPVIEGVSVLQTLWTVLLESRRQPVLVSSVREDLFGLPSAASLRELSAETVNKLGRYTPLTGEQAEPAQLKFDLIRLNNLLQLLDSAPPASLNSNSNWRSLWQNEWNRTERSIDVQSPVFSTVVSAETSPIIQDIGKANPEELSKDYLWMLVSATNLSPSYQALIQNYRNKIIGQEAGGSGQKTETEFHPLNPESYIFGASEGSINELRLQPAAEPALWTFWSISKSILVFAVPVILLLLSPRNLLSVSFRQFPYFWGTAFGLLFWVLCPPGFIGQTILLLTLLAFCYPVWGSREPLKNR